MPEVLAGTVNPGCRKLIAEHSGDVVIRSRPLPLDIGTPEDYERDRSRLSHEGQAATA